MKSDSSNNMFQQAVYSIQVVQHLIGVNDGILTGILLLWPLNLRLRSQWLRLCELKLRKPLGCFDDLRRPVQEVSRIGVGLAWGTVKLSSWFKNIQNKWGWLGVTCNPACWSLWASSSGSSPPVAFSESPPCLGPSSGSGSTADLEPPGTSSTSSTVLPILSRKSRASWAAAYPEVPPTLAILGRATWKDTSGRAGAGCGGCGGCAGCAGAVGTTVSGATGAVDVTAGVNCEGLMCAFQARMVEFIAVSWPTGVSKDRISPSANVVPLDRLTALPLMKVPPLLTSTTTISWEVSACWNQQWRRLAREKSNFHLGWGGSHPPLPSKIAPVEDEKDEVYLAHSQFYLVGVVISFWYLNFSIQNWTERHYGLLMLTLSRHWRDPAQPWHCSELDSHSGSKRSSRNCSMAEGLRNLVVKLVENRL